MKKKLLFCLHNYFFLDHYILDLNELKKKFEITIITSNYLIDNEKLEYKKLFNKVKFKNFFIVPFYKSKMARSFISIFFTHFYLLKIKKKINFKDFDICITDNLFFTWQRIIFENFISRKSKKVGIATGSLNLDLTLFKRLLHGKKIQKYYKYLHKLRTFNLGKRKKEKNFFRKLLNLKNRILDIIIDRKILSYLFYYKNYNYKKYDINLMETDPFDLKIVFHFSNYLFWKSVYINKGNVILASHSVSCRCASKRILKNRILFLPSLSWKSDYIEISKQVDNVINFLNNQIVKKNSINEIHIKHHPMEEKDKIEIINKIFIVKSIHRVKVKFLDAQTSLYDIACNYDIAFGMTSTALADVKKNCNKIKVYCLKSLSVHEYGDNYFLKLLNEDIIFYDDLKNSFDSKVNIYKKTFLKVHKEKFSKIIFNLNL